MITGDRFIVTADYIGEYGGGSYINLTCKACGVDVLESIRDKRQEVTVLELLALTTAHDCPNQTLA